MERPHNLSQFIKLLKVRSGGRPRNGDQFIQTLKFKLPKGRRRGPGSMPALVEPPRGPAPKSGGAAAALEFED